MVCSSSPVFGDYNNLSCNGTLHIQQSKAPPLNNALLKSLLNNSEKLSWSQTKVLKMSKPGTSWDSIRQSDASQRHQQFATLLDDDEFVPPNIELKPHNNKIVPPNIELKPHNNKIVPTNIELKPHNSKIVPPNIELKPHNNKFIPPKIELKPYDNKCIPPKIEHKPHDNKFVPPNIEHKEEVSIIGYSNKKEATTNNCSTMSQGTSIYSTIPKGDISRNTVDVSNMIKYQNLPKLQNPKLQNILFYPKKVAFQDPRNVYPNIYPKQVTFQETGNNYPNVVYPKKVTFQDTNVYPNVVYPNNVTFQGIGNVYPNVVYPKTVIQATGNVTPNIVYPKKVTFQETGNVTKVENKLENIYSNPAYSQFNTQMTNETKKQLAEHLRQRRISEAIEAAIKQPQQLNHMNKDQISNMSNWSISQKLDHKTHELKPLTLKLKKNIKSKGIKKRTKRCNKNAECPLNCVGCKNSHTDGVKKKQSNPKKIENQEINILDILPEDGNYLIIRKVIEECPMCYAPLNIRKCSVNISLLLYTYYCECGLTIFHIPHTPKNITHPIKIIES